MMRCHGTHNAGEKHAAASAAAFVPLIFAPGEAYQFD
jgi:hypothetical protein